jgi:hypothetical protein
MTSTALPTPRLTAVVPTRNRPELLARAVRSALVNEFEVVVVDDHSAEDMSGVLASIGAAAVTLIRLHRRRGPLFARNVGVRAATGDYLVMLDDDDVLLPNAAAAIIAAIARVPGQRLFMHNVVDSVGRHSVDRDIDLVDVTITDWLQASTPAGPIRGDLLPVVAREVFARHRYDDTGVGGEGLLWARLIREQGAVVSGKPVLRCTTDGGRHRLTSAATQLSYASENAAVGAAWLEEIGEELRACNTRRWAQRVIVAAGWELMSGQRRAAVARLADAARLTRSPSLAAVRVAMAIVPRSLARLAFALHRRELVTTVRHLGVRRALTGR